MNKKILVPLVTPFREDESVDYEMLKKLVRYELDSGADGLYVGGSSAECFLLTAEERKKVLETAVRAADGAFVVANIGSIGTAVAEDFAAHAAKAGADVISSVPPFYFAFSFSEIDSYYRDLVKKTGLPMMIYNIPSNTHAKFGLGDLESLLAEEGMDYMKFTDTDYFMLEQLKSHTGKFIYSGKDEDFLSALAAGADGGIGTTFNFMVGRFVEIQKLYKEGKMSEAKEVQHGANELVRAVCDCGLIASVKYMLELLGYPCGGARRPFAKLTDEKKKYLKEKAVSEKLL